MCIAGRSSPRWRRGLKSSAITSGSARAPSVPRSTSRPSATSARSGPSSPQASWQSANDTFHEEEHERSRSATRRGPSAPGQDKPRPPSTDVGSDADGSRAGAVHGKEQLPMQDERNEMNMTEDVVAQRAIVLQVLREDHTEPWTR